MTTFKKDDKEKPRVGLLPPRATLEVSRVLTFGAKKYGPDNWRNVPPEERHRYLDAAGRHLLAYMGGERLDPDSNLPTLAHAACCVLFLLDLDLGDEP